MKKLLLALVIVSALVPIVRAEEGETLREQRRERVEDRIEAKEAEINEIRLNLQEVRSKVAENHANRLERRFKFYYERLTKIMDKFQARIEFLKTEGKDTAAVQTKLDAARAKLEEAKVKGEEAIAAFKAIDPAKWEEQKPAILSARDLAVAARKLYMETFTMLKDALKELKKISKPALPAASPAVNNSL